MKQLLDCHLLHLLLSNQLKHNTRHWHESVSESDSASNHDPLVKLEENIINSINSLKEEIINLKDIVIKPLQDENERLRAKCGTLENKVVTLEQNLNSLGQYGRKNNLVLAGIPESIPDNHLENTVSSILSDIGVSIQSEEIEACHRFGKTDRKTKSKKTIVRFVNKKHCKKALLNKKKLSNINNGKFKFNAETKLYINENLTSMNDSIAFNCRKVNRSNIIHTFYTRDRILHIKQEESSKPFNIFHISKLHELFPDFVFADDEKGDVNTSVLSSYWLITKFIKHKQGKF